jgi:starch synthase
MPLTTQPGSQAPLRVLFATSEALPLIKTGGLADVSGSLPRALRRQGHDVRLMIPAYPAAMRNAGRVETAATLRLPGVREPIHLLAGTLKPGKLPVYLVSAHEHFDRGGNPYTDLTGSDWGDNPDRFALLCRVIALAARDRVSLGWRPDLVHCNDWQTGLAPLYLAQEPDAPATLFTIHNLSYQGIFDRGAFDRIGLPEDLWRPDALEFHGGFSFLKSGITYAQRVNTVSPTYAREVLTPALGYGLDGLLRHLGRRFTGILNGIDYQEWDPASDPAIAAPYDAEHLDRKRANKEAVQREFGLPERPDALVFGYVGRLVEQKGVDLILGTLPRLLGQTHVQVLFQGTGNRGLERALREAQQRHPDRVGAFLGYDEEKAHRIEAGSDAFLMPSRFEPCGLNQLYSLRYGTVPVVHRTGGLADTVVDATPANLEAGTATGFVFENADVEGLWYALRHTLSAWRREEDWRQLALTGMRQDFSWEASARRYESLYREAIEERGARTEAQALGNLVV